MSETVINKSKPFEMSWGSKQQDCLGAEISAIESVEDSDIERIRFDKQKDQPNSNK